MNDCKEYVEVDKDTKVKCYYYVRGGMCTIVEKRCCTVAPPVEAPDVNRISHSTVSTFKDCRRKVWLEKIKRIYPKVRQPYFITGEVLHKLAQNIYDGKYDHTYDSIKEMFDKLESQDSKADTIKAVAIMTSYIGYMGQNHLLHFPSLVTEYVYDGEYLGYPVQMRYDGVGKDRSYFVEHKFTGTNKGIANIGKLEHADQLSLGFELMPEAERCVLNIVKKVGFQFNPLKETLQDFMNRAKKDIEKAPGKYFRPVVYQRSDFDLKSFREEFGSAVYDLMNIPRTAGSFYKNPKSCSMMDCQYQSICETGVVSPEEYVVYVPKGTKE